MTKLLDKICKCRDILTKTPEKIYLYAGVGGLFDTVTEEMHRQLSKKVKDPTREIEFSSRDLLEFSEEIRAVLKCWETEMDPKRTIKKILKLARDTKQPVDFYRYMEPKLELMSNRSSSISVLTKALSVFEYHSVFLYFLEEVSHDEFALQITERFN